MLITSFLSVYLMYMLSHEKQWPLSHKGHQEDGSYFLVFYEIDIIVPNHAKSLIVRDLLIHPQIHYFKFAHINQSLIRKF